MELANIYYENHDNKALCRYIEENEDWSLETVKILLTKKDIEPIISDLSIIAQHGETEILKELLKWKDSDGNGIDPSENNNRVLTMASRNGQIESVKILLKDTRVNSNDKIQALEMAFRKHQEEVIQELLKDPNLQYYIDKKKRNLEEKLSQLRYY